MTIEKLDKLNLKNKGADSILRSIINSKQDFEDRNRILSIRGLVFAVAEVYVDESSAIISLLLNNEPAKPKKLSAIKRPVVFVSPRKNVKAYEDTNCSTCGGVDTSKKYTEDELDELGEDHILNVSDRLSEQEDPKITSKPLNLKLKEKDIDLDLELKEEDVEVMYNGLTNLEITNQIKDCKVIKRISHYFNFDPKIMRKYCADNNIKHAYNSSKPDTLAKSILKHFKS
jgi:hypothetical protein